jgi:hypothetical protein
MSSLNLIAELFIRTQKRIHEIPSLTVNWLRVKVSHADKKILQLKKGDLGAFVAIIAVYPGTSTFNSVARLIAILESNGYSTLIVINENSEASRWFEKLSSPERTLIVRPNIGADFGAYKCGFNYLRSHRSKLEVVLIANDSLHYTSDCEKSLSPLLDPASPMNCLFLNFQAVIHAGSMLIKFDSIKLSSDIFWDFWEYYHCTNSKKRIIKYGEHKLTEVCGVKTFRPLTDTFSNIDLPQPTMDHRLQFLRWARRTDMEFFDCYLSLQFDSYGSWQLAFYYGLENYQVSNSLGLYLTNHFGLPIKMDLLKHGLVSRTAYMSGLQTDNHDPEELRELGNILNRYSYSRNNSFMEKIKRF